MNELIQHSVAFVLILGAAVGICKYLDYVSAQRKKLRGSGWDMSITPVGVGEIKLGFVRDCPTVTEAQERCKQLALEKSKNVIVGLTSCTLEMVHYDYQANIATTYTFSYDGSLGEPKVQPMKHIQYPATPG